VPIIEDLEPILKEWKLKCPPPKTWLFPGRGNTPLYSPSWDKYNFKPLLKKLELPDVKFHSLRKLCVKILLDYGVPLREVMRIVGHTDPKITLAIYDSVTSKRLVDVSRKVSVFRQNRDTIRRKNVEK
jgi:integrase